MNKRKQQADTPVLEWLLGGIGASLLLACIAFLVHDGLSNDEDPGEITTSVLEVTAAGDAHIVTFSVHNAGSQTLSNLHVSARLLEGEREIERATTLIDYLPGHSAQEVGFYFLHDPKRYRLELRPEGYLKP